MLDLISLFSSCEFDLISSFSGVGNYWERGSHIGLSKDMQSFLKKYWRTQSLLPKMLCFCGGRVSFSRIWFSLFALNNNLTYKLKYSLYSYEIYGGLLKTVIIRSVVSSLIFIKIVWLLTVKWIDSAKKKNTAVCKFPFLWITILDLISIFAVKINF